jgi:nucleoside-diphosphate-sugar epimerase
MDSLLNNEYKIDFTVLKDKTILITGASGLIGIHLLTSIKQKQKELNITIYTWNKTPNPMLSEIFSNCNTIYSDITEVNDLNFLPNFDYIIHSSGYGQPSKFLDNKIKTIEINTSVTLSLLNKLKPNGTFLFISSSEVYNGLFEYDITEERIGMTNPTHPRSPYIEGKRCGESICNIFRETGKDIKIVRLGITYGPGTQKGDTRVINSLIDKGLNNDNIELLDDGSSLRSFCYITDAVEMIWNILFNGKEFIYNVANTNSMSILELSNIIGGILNKEIKKPETNNGLEGNPVLVNLSIDRYLKEFKKDKFISIEDGIRKTINWQKILNEKY